MPKEFYYKYATSIGDITIICNSHAVKAVLFGNHIIDNAQNKPSDLSDECFRQIEDYLCGKRFLFDLPLEPEGTPFQRKVWDALCSIPYGETRSYSQIAEAIDNPKAYRAVGMANNKNPIPIIIPCHRVIGKNGSLIGYAYGLKIKSELLNVEKTHSRYNL